MFSEVSNIEYRDINGVLESIQPLEEVGIDTAVGNLTPIYEVEDHGRLKLTPVKFFKTGELKSLQLQSRKIVETSAGDFHAELITFYENGNICRLFPLNGKLSGYWSQENEYKLAESVLIKTYKYEIRVKPISLYFYKTGELKSITFWPGEIVDIEIPVGKVKVRTGISFYRDGSIQSLEPAEPVKVSTPIGEIEAFDPEPIGINGDRNSLKFNEDGTIESLGTVSSEVTVSNGNGSSIIYSPEVKPGRCSDDEKIVLPLKIKFEDAGIQFKHGFREIGRAESIEDCACGEFSERFSYELICSKNT